MGVSEFSIGERRRTYISATILNRLCKHSECIHGASKLLTKIAKTNRNETWTLLALRVIQNRLALTAMLLLEITMKRFSIGNPVSHPDHGQFIAEPSKLRHAIIHGLRWPMPAILAVNGLILAVVLCSAHFAHASIVLENFEHSGADGLPAKWRASNDDAKTIYRIEAENGNRFLRARADNKAVQLGLEHSFDPKSQPRLKWRWRVHELPKGADERVKGKHDAAAQVYVIFDNQTQPRVVKYTWSSSLPVGTQFTSPLYSRNKGIVRRSGQPDGRRWYEEEVKFLDDFKKLFGAEPGKVQGIAILTSSDATKTTAAADYDDFVLLP